MNKPWWFCIPVKGSVWMSLADILLATLIACAIVAGTGPAHCAEATPLVYLLEWDEDLSSRAGAQTLLSVHRLYRFADDRYWGTPGVGERDERNAVGIAARVGKTLLFDAPVAFTIATSLHEVFGHGARAREFGAREIDYEVGGIWPYSGKQWVTRWTLPRDPLQEQIGVEAGGMEATGRLAHELAFRWIERGEIDHREALLYLMAFHDETDYILRRFDARNSDPQDYVALINRYYGSRELDRSDLQREVLINLLDSFTYMAFWNQMQYQCRGDERWTFPRLRIGAVSLLPGLRLSLSPFGPEYYAQGYASPAGVPAYAYLRYGEQAGRRFYGVGFEARRVWQRPRLSLDLELDLWRQPELGVPAAAARDRGGMEALLRVHYRFLERFEAAVAIGAKTTGFVPGEAFANGPIIRLAVGFLDGP